MQQSLTVILTILLAVMVPAGLVYFALKAPKVLVIVLGVVAVLAALPVGFFAELGINGCCGAPSTGYEGSGYAIGALVGIIGFALIIYASICRKKKPARIAKRS